MNEIEDNMTRLDANVLILIKLTQEVNDYPDLRFNQILVNLSLTTESKFFDEWNNLDGNASEIVINEVDYYEESEATLKRILDNLPT